MENLKTTTDIVKKILEKHPEPEAATTCFISK